LAGDGEIEAPSAELCQGIGIETVAELSIGTGTMQPDDWCSDNRIFKRHLSFMHVLPKTSPRG